MLGHSSENDWSGHDSLLLCSPGDEAPQAPCLARLLGVVEVVELRVTFHEVLDVVEVGGDDEGGCGGGRPTHDMERGSEFAPGAMPVNESSVRLRR
jgi:hypothetical protein